MACIVITQAVSHSAVPGPGVLPRIHAVEHPLDATTPYGGQS